MSRRMPFWIALSALLLGADLATKSWAVDALTTPINIIGTVISLSVSFNEGVAFSIPIPNMVMLIITPLLVALFAYMLISHGNIHSTLTKTVLSLMMAGGLGNLISRIEYGAVVDFIRVGWWPSFNLADSYLTIAAFLIIIFYGKITTYGRNSK